MLASSAMLDHSNAKGEPLGPQAHALPAKCAKRTMESWWSRLVAPALIGILAFGLYTNTFKSGFVYDDDFALVRRGCGGVTSFGGCGSREGPLAAPTRHPEACRDRRRPR